MSEHYATPRIRTLGTILAGILLLAGLGIGTPAAGEPDPATLLDPTVGLARFELVHFDVDDLRNQALLGLVTITLLGWTYSFDVTPRFDAPIGDVIMSTDENGFPVALPVEIILFDGHDAAQNATAMFSLNGHWVSGVVETAQENIYFEPRNPRGGTGMVETVVYRQSDVLPVPEPTGDGSTDAMPAQPPPDALPVDDNLTMSASGGGSSNTCCKSGSGSTKSTSTSGSKTSAQTSGPGTKGGGCSPCSADVFIIVDQDYVNTFGGMTWPDKTRTIMGLVSTKYSGHGVTFFVRTQSKDWMATTAKDLDPTFENFKRNYPYDATKSYQWHVMMSGFDFNGCGVGMGSLPADTPHNRATVNQQVGDACHVGRPSSDYMRAYVVKHEMGHNHNGDHQYADSWLDNGGGKHRTIMEESFWGTLEDWFSDGKRDPNHNNKARIESFIRTFKR